MAEWGDFFVAQAGASAALAGLIFVGISISLDVIIANSHLVYRAGATLVILLSTLVTSSILLAPLSSDRATGAAVLGVGCVFWMVTTVLGVIGVRRTPRPFRHSAWIIPAIEQAAMIPLVISGIVLLASGSDGLYWLLPGFMTGYVVALLNGWVLLVETHR